MQLMKVHSRTVLIWNSCTDKLKKLIYFLLVVLCDT